MKIYFIGIGGIGVSALAQYYLKTGHQVSGSDLASSEITDFLKKKGAKIIIGAHMPNNIQKNIDLVIYSPAVKEENPELKKAKELKIKCLSYPRALGELTKKYYTIAVSGAHGKSTTTALMSVVLMRAGLDPTVIIGTKLKEFGNSNFRMGKGRYLIIESDEYKSSFLNYWPKIIVLTNLEYEHPDYFRNPNHYLGIFKKYLKHLESNDGIIVANKEDKYIPKLIKGIKAKKYFFSVKQDEAKKLKTILKIPGKHNVKNSLAALTVARLLKIPDKKIFKALSEYKGAWRRFEIMPAKINNKRITIISDYGHHPTQVKSTIAAAKEKYLHPPKFSKGKIRRAGKKIWIIYQPHQYLRTHYFFKDYVKAFDGADEIVLSEIYAVAGREKKEIVKNLSSKNLAEAIERRFEKIGKSARVHFIKDYLVIPEFLKSRVKNSDVVIIMGAGDIYNLTRFFR